MKSTNKRVRATAAAAVAAISLGVAGPAFAAEQPAPATVNSTIGEFIPGALDGVDVNAIVVTIPGFEELKKQFNDTASTGRTAYVSTVKAEASVEKAAKAANRVKDLADQPLPGTLAETIAHGKEIAAAAVEANASFEAAKADVEAAYGLVVSTRDQAVATIAQAKVVRANAEAILRDPAISPATRDAAMDALSVIGANIADSEHFVELANATLAKVAAVKAAAAKAQDSIAKAKALAPKIMEAEKALDAAAKAAVKAVNNAVSAAKAAVARVLPAR